MSTPEPTTKADATDAIHAMPEAELITHEQVAALVQAHRDGGGISSEEAWLVQLPPERRDEVHFLVQREAQHQHLSEASSRKRRLRRYALLASGLAMMLWLVLSPQVQSLWRSVDAFARVVTWDVNENTPWATRAYIARHYDGAVRERALYSLLLRPKHKEIHKDAHHVLSDVLHKMARSLRDRPIDALWRHPQLKSRFWGNLPTSEFHDPEPFDPAPLVKVLRRAHSPHVQYALAKALHRAHSLPWKDALALYKKSPHPATRKLGATAILRALRLQISNGHWNFLPYFRSIMSLPSVSIRRAAMKTLVLYTEPYVLSRKGPFVLAAFSLALHDRDQHIRRKAMSWLKKHYQHFSQKKIGALLVPFMIKSKDLDLRAESRRLLLSINSIFWWKHLPKDHLWRRVCQTKDKVLPKRLLLDCALRKSKGVALRKRRSRL